jgi:hypothetical protein
MEKRSAAIEKMLTNMQDHWIQSICCFNECRKTFRAWWVYLAIFSALLAGCDSSRQTYPAGGTVLFDDGKPLSQGLVTFRLTGTAESVTARGPIQRDGTFTLTTFKDGDGAIAGTHQALVVVPLVESYTGPPPINRKFSSYESSKLEFTVTKNAQQNQFKIVVTK